MIGGKQVGCVSQGIKVVMWLGLYPRSVMGYQHPAVHIQSSSLCEESDKR